jgi:hypothetical protein
MSKTFSVWLYADETGWWLEEEGYDDAGDACAALATFLSRSLVGQEVAVWWSGGAVVPAGEFPMPMCEKCLRRPRRKHGHRWSGAGYVCADCGAIKDTGTETANCPGAGQ